MKGVAMTLFWPDQKVALRIVDDPSGANFNPADYPGYKVVEVTCEQVRNPDAVDEIADELAILLGRKPIARTPEWKAKNRALHAQLFAGL